MINIAKLSQEAKNFPIANGKKCSHLKIAFVCHEAEFSEEGTFSREHIFFSENF